MGTFRIKTNKFEWIGGVSDDPQDRCLHGHVTVQFGDTVLEDIGTVYKLLRDELSNVGFDAIL